MELKLNISKHSEFPIGGFLISGSNPKTWLLELQALNFSLNQVKIYPVPGNVPNVLWGCFVLSINNLNLKDVGKNEGCQRVFPNLYIPEKAKLVPQVLASDYERHFQEKMHLFHPDFGLVELSDDFKLAELLEIPSEQFVYTFKPAKSVFIPTKIDRFEIRKVEDEDPLKKLEDKVVPHPEKLDDKPLSLKEKAKLKLYSKLFNRKKNKEGKEELEPNGLLKGINKLKGVFGAKGESEGMKRDLENLEERNKEQVDRLMDMLKNNPDEGLKYAVPLDQNGSNRGTNDGLIDISKRWGGLSLFGGIIGGLFGGLGGMSGGGNQPGGGSVDIGDGFQRLSDQYYKTATELLAKKEYEKAAFVYLKLLKRYDLAGGALEDGGLYHEAAQVYLKYMNDKTRAAKAFEKGKMITEAIELYEELKDHEKVGDLYVSLNKRALANEAYQRKVDVFLSGFSYFKAAEIYRNKMLLTDEAQLTLMRGWDEGRHGYDCLTTFLANYPEKNRISKINEIRQEKVDRTNREEFLRVIHHEFKKDGQKEQEELREMAYSLVAEHVTNNPYIVEELRKFNLKDKEIIKDTTRFKILRGKSKRN